MEIKIKSKRNAIFLIFSAILIWWMFSNLKFIGKGLSLLLGVLLPFIIGLVIAFILNKPMSFIEEKLFGEDAIFQNLKEKFKRPMSFLITILLVLLIFTLVLIIIVPSFIEAGEELGSKLPKYWENINSYIDKSPIKSSKISNWVGNIDLDEIYSGLNTFIRGGFSSWIGSTVTIFSSVIGGIISTGLGIVFAIYFLLQKEDLSLSIERFIYASLPLNIANRILYIARITNESFSQFITGQSLDALILGGMFFIVMTIFQFPYAILVSITIAICAIIPIVGSFIGLLIGAFLIFVESPKMAGFFIILFLVLQQIEGNIIYPKVVGKASGLSPVWILTAVTLGGSLMGILGIIIFVPMFSVIQKLLKEYVDNELKEKNIDTL